MRVVLHPNSAPKPHCVSAPVFSYPGVPAAPKRESLEPSLGSLDAEGELSPHDARACGQSLPSGEAGLCLPFQPSGSLPLARVDASRWGFISSASSSFFPLALLSLRRVLRLSDLLAKPRSRGGPFYGAS